MVKYFRHGLFLLSGFLLGIPGFAQMTNEPPQMADGLRSNGKIYVVVTVLLVILLGIALYLVRLDRKITRLEKGRE
jgi:CcmD family protein